MLNPVIAQLRPTAVNRVLAEVRALQAQGVQLVSLMRGEPDFRTPPHIVEAAARAMEKGRTTYPDNRGEIPLREAAGARHGYDPGTEVLVTTGATLGISCALTALLSPGDQVLVPDPIYDAYLSPIRLAGGEAVRVPARVDGGRFTIDPESLERAATPRTRAMLLNTPWNPVGTVFTQAELGGIGDFIARRELTLISDEIYDAITFDGFQHFSAADVSPELRKRTILIQSLSKTYAMTGWRVGYCCGPKEIIQAMFLVLQQSSRGPAMFVQDAAAAALAGPQDCVAEMRAEYARRRARVLDALAGIDGVQAMPPEGGFFAMVDVRGLGQPSDVVRKRLLEKHGLVVIHGSAYGEMGEGTLRVSFASGGALEPGLERLRKGLMDRQ